MKQDKFYQLLDGFEIKGLNLYNLHNCDINKAKRLAYENDILVPAYVLERGYVLGNVLSETEYIGDVPFNHMFHAIEYHIGLYKVDSDTQKKLHDTLNSFFKFTTDNRVNKYVISKDILKELKNVCGKRYKDYFNRVAYTYNGYMKDIVEELSELLKDIEYIDRYEEFYGGRE